MNDVLFTLTFKRADLWMMLVPALAFWFVRKFLGFYFDKEWWTGQGFIHNILHGPVLCYANSVVWGGYFTGMAILAYQRQDIWRCIMFALIGLPAFKDNNEMLDKLFTHIRLLWSMRKIRRLGERLERSK